jgi:hypothetical protein
MSKAANFLISIIFFARYKVENVVTVTIMLQNGTANRDYR